MKYSISIAIFTCLVTPILSAQERSHDSKVIHLIQSFLAQYQELKIPTLTPDYRQNLVAIQSLEGINRQEHFFDHYHTKLKGIDVENLSSEVSYLYWQLQYELELNRMRIKLEKDFRRKHAGTVIPLDGLYKLPRHRDWYRFYLRWVASKNITPDEVLRLGEAEVNRVSGEIKKIQRAVGYEGNDKGFYQHLSDESFFITDEKTVLSLFEQKASAAYLNSGRVVDASNIPMIKIQAFSHPNKDLPPGAYNDGVFYFNFFGGRYNRRALDWLLIHEAMPGHHYQMSFRQIPALVPELRDLFWYQGFTEGWGAYVESLGKEMGFFTDPYLYLGKWEWDLVRSARLVLDVGIHLKGWSRKVALEYWRKNVPHQLGIADREIDRVTRWPGQAVSYKIGESEIFKLKRQLQKRLGKEFDQKKFHSTLLARGAVPLEIIRKIVLTEYSE